MPMTRDQEIVLKSIVTLGKRDNDDGVTISAIHGTFSDLDVRDLFDHLEHLLGAGLIKNARETKERFANSFLVTKEGMEYYDRVIRERS